MAQPQMSKIILDAIVNQGEKLQRNLLEIILCTPSNTKDCGNGTP